MAVVLSTVAVALSVCHVLIAGWRVRAMVTLLANLSVATCAYKAGKACEAADPLVEARSRSRSTSENAVDDSIVS